MLIAGKKCKGIRHYNIEKLSDQLMADDYRPMIDETLAAVTVNLKPSSQLAINHIWDKITEKTGVRWLSKSTLELVDDRQRQVL